MEFSNFPDLSTFRFHEAITLFNLSMISENRCLYVKRTIRVVRLLTLYIDDILLTGNKLEIIILRSDCPLSLT